MSKVIIIKLSCVVFETTFTIKILFNHIIFIIYIIYVDIKNCEFDKLSNNI